MRKNLNLQTYIPQNILNKPVRLSIKKVLFPVQRVAKIEASRPAANFFFSMKILSILGKKKFLAKMKKKSPVAYFF